MRSMEKTYKIIPTWQEIKANYPECSCLLFDMDGTLIPTEPIHEDAFLLMGKKYNVEIPRNADTHFSMQGMADEQVFEVIKFWKNFPFKNAFDFIHEKNQILLEMIPKLDRDKYIKKEMLKLIQDAKNDGSLIGLVTSSERSITESIFSTFNLSPYFEIVITRQEVKNPKPHPEPYLMAMKFLSKKANHCVIFEDSIVGLEAARSSGANAIKADWW